MLHVFWHYFVFMNADYICLLLTNWRNQQNWMNVHDDSSKLINEWFLFFDREFQLEVIVFTLLVKKKNTDFFISSCRHVIHDR